MSHIVTVKTEIRDHAAITAACGRLGLEAPTVGTADLFEGAASGTIVKLKGWNYPLVINEADGTIRFDNYGGDWGDAKRLDEFKQAYAVEKTKLEARKKGYMVAEQPQEDGSVRLRITVS